MAEGEREINGEKKTWGRKVVLFNFCTPFSSASGYEIHLYLYRGWKRDTLEEGHFVSCGAKS